LIINIIMMKIIVIVM